MKITVLGTRGFPNVQGGVETHCENLFPRLAGLGCDVTVITRLPYVDPGVASHKGVRLVPLDCPRNKFLEAIVLLEAMSYGLSCVVSDIPANREVALEDSRYFKPGDIEEMAAKIEDFWDEIARKTLEAYKHVK